MKLANISMVVVLSIAALQLAACTKTSDAMADIAPAKVEPVEGTELSHVVLTPKAAERLGIETAPVREAQVARNGATHALADPVSLNDPGSPTPAVAEDSGKMQKVVPYSAVLYDVDGNTWVYKSPEPFTFVRHQVEVDYIEGDVAVLLDGPATGSEVVTVGVAELLGTEYKIGH